MKEKLLNIVKSLTSDNPSTDIKNIICNNLNQYKGSDTCKGTLSNICNQNDLAKLIYAADQCGAWFFQNTSPVYQCEGVNLLTTETSLPQTASSVINSVSTTSSPGIITSVSSGSTNVVGTVSLNKASHTIYYASSAIVQYAPSNNAELYDAIQDCNSWAASEEGYGVYNPIKCSNVASLAINSYQACVGAIFSPNPAWTFDIS